MNNLLIENKEFDALFEKLNSFFMQIEHTADNFVDVLVKAMEMVEEWSRGLGEKLKIHGLEKKELVEGLIEKLADKFESGADVVQLHVKYWMDKLIDILVTAAKGQLHFNETIKAGCGPCKKTNSKKVKAHATPKDVGEVDKVIEQVHNEVKNAIVNKQFTASNFIVLVTLVMQVVEKAPQLTGPEKKEVAVKVIKRLILEIPMPGADKEAIGIIVETTLSKTIDFIIAAANGEFDFGKIVEQWKSCFPCCYKQ